MYESIPLRKVNMGWLSNYRHTAGKKLKVINTQPSVNQIFTCIFF